MTSPDTLPGGPLDEQHPRWTDTRTRCADKRPTITTTRTTTAMTAMTAEAGMPLPPPGVLGPALLYLVVIPAATLLATIGLILVLLPLQIGAGRAKLRCTVHSAGVPSVSCQTAMRGTP